MAKKLFISGRMSGNKYYKAEFENAKRYYEKQGYTVVIPSVLPIGLSNADYVRICLAMLDSCDEAAFLPNWEMSPGARLEHAYCTYVQKPILLFEDDVES